MFFPNMKKKKTFLPKAWKVVLFLSLRHKESFMKSCELEEYFIQKKLVQMSLSYAVRYEATSSRLLISIISLKLTSFEF